jgi:hypothetical protein
MHTGIYLSSGSFPGSLHYLARKNYSNKLAAIPIDEMTDRDAGAAVRFRVL